MPEILTIDKPYKFDLEFNNLNWLLYLPKQGFYLVLFLQFGKLVSPNTEGSQH